MRIFLFTLILTLTGYSISYATAIRAPEYGALIGDVNHVVLGEITNIKSFEYVIEGNTKTCAYELTINVHKDRKDSSSKLTILTTQTEIEYIAGRNYLFISSTNSAFDQFSGNQVKFDCSYEKSFIQKEFVEEHKEGCALGVDLMGGKMFLTALDKLPFEDEIMIEAEEFCYRMNHFKAKSEAYQNIIIEARQMIFPIDETVVGVDGGKWISINPKWWLLFDIDFKDAIKRKKSARNEYSLWKKANVTREVYEVVDLDQFVGELFPSNTGTWAIK